MLSKFNLVDIENYSFAKYHNNNAKINENFQLKKEYR